jgi:hypothetical protein
MAGLFLLSLQKNVYSAVFSGTKKSAFGNKIHSRCNRIKAAHGGKYTAGFLQDR